MTNLSAGMDQSESSLKELASDICRRYRALLGELRIEAVAGGVALHGRAYSFYGKQVAQHEVLRRSGLVVLVNRIAVAGRSGATV